MTKLDEHPTVVRHRRSPPKAPAEVLDAERLRRLCLDAGADDVGFVSIRRPELDDQRADILRVYPWTRGLVSIVCKMNREPILPRPVRSRTSSFTTRASGPMRLQDPSSVRSRPKGTVQSIRRWASPWRWTAPRARFG